MQPRDVVDERQQIVTQERVAADEDEAARSQADALVDHVAPLVRGELAHAPRVGDVVAVRARETTAVGDVQVNLAQALERLAARLLASAWFARNVVIDRWFLHSAQPARWFSISLRSF